MTTRTKNVNLARQIVEIIVANPSYHDQSNWFADLTRYHEYAQAQLDSGEWDQEWYDQKMSEVPQNINCGTTKCFAGWAAALNGAKFLIDDEGLAEKCVIPLGEGLEECAVEDLAKERLGITWEEASDLFYADNETIIQAAVNVFGEEIIEGLVIPPQFILDGHVEQMM